MRILVIEDNTDIAANIGDFLADKGHVVDFAGDGVTGLHLAVVNEFDVIVLDLGLPGMDGLEVCRKLRQEAKRQTPVLMLTARDNLDAKLTMALTATRDDEEAGDSNWTEYLKAFNVRMFKPDLAPADVVGESEPAVIENVVIETRIEADVTPPQLSNPLFGEHRPSRGK